MNTPPTGESILEQASAAEPPPRSRPYAFFVALGIFLSRVFGLIRERAITHYMGASPAAGAFKAALRIPNFLQNLFGEGVLSASFIPVYAKLLAEGDEKTAGRVAGSIATILALFVSVAALLGVAVSPLLVDLFAPGFTGEVRDLTVRLVRILFPGVGILVMSAWCLGILNSHRRFFLSYVAPVFWNLAMIATLVIFGSRLRLESLAVALSWGMVVGSALQFLVQVPFVFSLAKSLRFRFDARLAPVREVIRNFLPVVLGRGVVQVSAFVDEIIVSFLGAGTFAILTFAQTIYLLPISLFGMSVAASELPQMSSVVGATEEVREALRRRLGRGLSRIHFLIVPTSIAFVTIGDLLTAALYQTGRFGSGETRLVWYILVVIATGLPAFTAGRLYSSTFYAIRDPRTPVRFAIVRVIVSGSIGLALAIVFRDVFVSALQAMPGLHHPEVTGDGAALAVLGVTVGTVVGGWIEVYLLRRSLVAEIGKPEAAPREYGKIWAAGILAGIGGLFLGRPVASWIGVTAPVAWSFNLIAAAVGASLIFGAVYFVAGGLLRVPEAVRLVRRIPFLGGFLGSIPW